MERIRRRWWTAAITLVAGALVLGALLTAVFQVVMLMAPGYREDLADYVSRVARQPVEIGGVGLVWRGLAPRLELTDITLYGQDGLSPALIAERLRLGFGALRLMRGDTTPQYVELAGLSLFARIDGEGRFSLRGLDTAGGPARARQDWLRQLGRFENVRLNRCELHVDDERLAGPGVRVRLRGADLSFADGRGQARAELLLPAELGSSVQVEAEVRGDLEDVQTWSGGFRARVEDLRSLPWVMPYLADGAQLAFGGTRASFDGRIEQGALTAVVLQLDAERVQGRHQALDAAIDRLALQARLTPMPQGWDLDVERLQLAGRQGPWPPSRARLRLRRQADGALQVQADAGYLGLADVAPWLGLLPAVSAPPGVLAGVGGQVRGGVLRWSRPAPGAQGEPAPAQFSLHADLEAVSLEAGPQQPGFAGLRGNLVATESGGRLDLRQAPLVVEAPAVWQVPLQFTAVDAQLDWTRGGEGWSLQTDSLQAELDGGRAEGRARLDLARGQAMPTVDLDLRFSAPDLRPFKAYTPGFWRASLRQWLDRALVRGRIPAGHLRLQGRLDQFPFVEHPGRFSLDVEAADGELAFAPGWPTLQSLAGRLQVRGRSVAVALEDGRVMDNPITGGEARIEDWRVPELSLRGQSEGEIGRYYDFLRESPLAPRLSGLLSRTAARGQARVQVKLDVPLREINRTQARGEVRLRDVELDVAGVPAPVTGLYGDVLFDNSGAQADEIHGELFETQFLAAIRRDAARRMDLLAHFDFKPDADGRGLSALLPRFLRANLSGATRWTAEIPLSGEQAGRVTLRSELRGLGISLPRPMQKPAAESWPTRLELAAEAPWALRLGLQIPGRVGADLAFLGDDRGALLLDRARLRAGGGEPPLADAYGIHIHGSAAEIEPLAWIAALSRRPAGPAGAGSATTGVATLPVHVDLQAGRLWLGSLYAQDLRLRHAPAAGGWRTGFDGGGGSGELVFRNDDAGGQLQVLASRAQLGWQPRRDADSEQDRRPRTTATHPPADPAQLPRLELRVDDLRVGQAELGALELRTERIDHGQRLASLRSEGPDGSLQVQGRWTRRDARSAAELDFDFRTRQVQDVLAGLGYAPTVEAEHARVQGRLEWPEQATTAIQGLNWALGRGDLHLRMEDGVLRAVEPGAGRVLGLINFWAIPRRLNFNFGDVLSKGLAFDRLDGSFEVADGWARTDDLDLDAPSLNMEVRGGVGLLARQYDQRVKVVPDVSAGVTLGALVLGGPAAGVLALIAQEVLDQPLDQVGQLHYRLSGSWDNPQVERVGNVVNPPEGEGTTPDPGPRTFRPGGAR